MTLNDMSAQFNVKTGQALGFGLKSKKTGNTFKAIAKAIDGKFIIVSATDAKKLSTVDGDVDRYVFVDAKMNVSGGAAVKKSARRTEIEAQLVALRESGAAMEAREVELNSALEAVDTDLEALNEEIDGLTEELDSLDE